MRDSQIRQDEGLADIAHELGTPLSILPRELEAIIDGIRPTSSQSLNSLHSDILIVEDKRKIAALFSDYLTIEGLRCQQIHHSDRVAAYLRSHQPDLMLLDLQLPGRSSIDIWRELRQHSQLPVIMITARVDEIDRWLGLELGAVDYICKPFSPSEVVTRVKAVLRRKMQTHLKNEDPIRTVYAHSYGLRPEVLR